MICVAPVPYKIELLEYQGLESLIFLWGLFGFIRIILEISWTFYISTLNETNDICPKILFIYLEVL